MCELACQPQPEWAFTWMEADTGSAGCEYKVKAAASLQQLCVQLSCFNSQELTDRRSDSPSSGLNDGYNVK